MSLLALGINHTTAPVDVRERVAFSPEQIRAALLDVCDRITVDEVVILSTCNRTEIYLADFEDQHAVLQWLADFHTLNLEDLDNSHYSHHGADAVQHLMRVSCGLDSMVLGEPQILGQIKSAFAMAQEYGTVGAGLHTAFQQAFSVAKRVRSDTAIGQNPVSVAYAAVALSKRIFTNLSSSAVMVIGAGKTIELVARHLCEHGVKQLLVANRTLPNAQELVDSVGGEAMLLSDIPERLHEADIVISSTASQLPILGKGAVETALKRRKHRPVFMVDIAVPRDIEPQVGELDDVYLYTVDDLEEVIDENKRSRAEAAALADRIIVEGVDIYQKEVRAKAVVSTIRAYREQAEQLRDEEVERALKRLEKGEAVEDILQTLARSLTNKLLHQPTTRIKEASSAGHSDVVDLAQRIFEPEQKAEDNGKS